MATMRSLIDFVSRIQRASTVLGEALPSVAVGGGQSSGKSSALESVVGPDFLPRGSVVNLTVKDLSGSVKVAVEGQPEIIVQDIETTVRSYVDKPNFIILATTPANQDVATSDAIKLAREGLARRHSYILFLSYAVPLKGYLENIWTEGDRIYGVFDQQLPSALRKLPFNRHLALPNIQKVISEADGYQPHLVAPEQGYRRLIDISEAPLKLL